MVVNSLVAEGCPQLALQLCQYWLKEGMEVSLLTLSSSSLQLLSEFEYLDIPVYFYPYRGQIFRYPRLCWFVFRLCLKIRPQALLSFLFGWHFFIAIASKMAGVRNVCTHVGNLPPVNKDIAFLKFKLLVQLARPFTNKVICCSHYVHAAVLKEFSISLKESKVIYNACDTSRFDNSLLNQKLSFAQPPRLAMVARLEKHKDHPTLVEAIACLKKRGVLVELWLVGEGSCRNTIEDLIQRFGLNNEIQFLGSRRDIPEILSQIDIFIFSALQDEGFGIALAEAMVAGVPIVASDVGACLEILDSGRLGFLFEAGNASSLASSILNVLAEPHIAMTKAIAAKERAVRDFRIDLMANAYSKELSL